MRTTPPRLVATATIALVGLWLASAPAGAFPPRGRGARGKPAPTRLGTAQVAWWQAQGQPKKLSWSNLEQRQLRRMSRIGKLSVDTFFKRVSVSTSDGKGGRWVYSLEKAGEDTVSRRVHYGIYNEAVAVFSERTFKAGGKNQVFKTWTFRQRDKQLPERFREAVMGLGPGRRDVVSIRHAFENGKRIGTGISVAAAGRDFSEPSLIAGGFARVPRRKTATEKRISALYAKHVTEPLSQVRPQQFSEHRGYVQRREQVISAGRKIVAGQLGMTTGALDKALDTMLHR